MPLVSVSAFFVSVSAIVMTSVLKAESVSSFILSRLSVSANKKMSLNCRYYDTAILGYSNIKNFLMFRSNIFPTIMTSLGKIMRLK